MENVFYKEYYQNNPVFRDTKKKKYNFIFFKNNIKKIISKEKQKKDFKILEIGSGSGNFAAYCKSLGISDYTGFDLDSNIIKITQKKFPDYKFYNSDIFDFLGKKKETFDMIFLAHVFEHLNKKKGLKLSSLIFKSLKKNGTWINAMPNAECPYLIQRYLDVTHEIIYSENSFSQVLIESGFKKENIIHKEQILGSNILIRYILKITKIFHKIFLLSAGLYPPRIMTGKIFSIIKK